MPNSSTPKKRSYRRGGTKRGRSVNIYLYPEDLALLDYLKDLTGADKTAALRMSLRMFVSLLETGRATVDSRVLDNVITGRT